MLKRIFTLLMIIISSSIGLSYGSPRIREEIARKRADNLDYKLSENVFPEHYTLKLSPQFNNNTFTGYAKILIHVKIPTSNITLHAKHLNITKEKIYLTTKDAAVINIKDAGESGTNEQEFYTITFTEILSQNTYYLHIPEFYGLLLDISKGFYYAHYTDENGKLRKFATTFFESTGARFAFPCFDEPSFRAKFKIYLVRPPKYHSLSNTKLMKSIKLNNSLYEDEFEDTVSMSTYLVAFVVSEMKLSTSPDNNIFRVCARPEVINKGYAKSSLHLSVKLLQALKTYLNVNYTLKKIDQVVIPDEFCPTAGMENWGLITYKESFFLITPQTEAKKQLGIASIVAHELAHQWFGNLVSIKWWRYLWLKEGFAQFLQSKILDIVMPEWQQMEQYVAMEKHDILEQDSFIINRNMNQDAGTPSEIKGLYDRISYDKAGCIVHMLEAIMTPKIFRLGITKYLQERAFQSVVPIDLYQNFQTSLDKSAVKLPQKLSIKRIMATWVTQSGYPLVYVRRDYDRNQEVVKLSQSLYVNAKDDFTPKPTTWYIPINYASKSDPNFNDTQASNWLLKPEKRITVPNLKKDDWLILNKQQAFFYRVNYDEKNWKLIAKALKKNYKSIHKLNRAQLIEDSFSLAKMNNIDFSIPLEICSYLHQEDDYIILSVFLRNMDYIRKIIHLTNIEPNFQKFVMLSLIRSYERLGNNHGSKDTLIDKLHRIEVVRWMCEFNYPECRANSWKIFDEWRKNNKSLDVDLENDIMCNAIRHGNEDDWNYLFKIYKSTSDDDFREKVFGWLGCSENVSILLNFMDSSLNQSAKYSFDEVMLAICDKGPVGFNVSKQYVIDHFSDLESTMHVMHIELILININAQFRTEAQVDEFKNSLPKSVDLDLRWMLTFDSARIYIAAQRKRTQQISKFFQSYNPPRDLNQRRSDGNLCHVLPNILVSLLYSLIIIVYYVYP